MKFVVFREMPVGTMFELSGLKFKKVEHSQRPDAEGYYNALQLDIKDGYAWVKEDNLFRVITPEDLEAEKQRRKKKKRRRRRDSKSAKRAKPGGRTNTAQANKSNKPAKASKSNRPAKTNRPPRRQNRPKPKNT